jgi:hypothetical protein
MSSTETALVTLQLCGAAAQSVLLVAWGYVFNLQTPRLGKDPLLFKGGLLVVFGLWGLIKATGGSARLAETEVTKPFRLTMAIIGTYFTLAAACCDIAGLSFPPWEEVPPITDAPNWIWANMIATNFTFSLGLLYLSIAIQATKIHTYLTEAILFTFMYNMRNSPTNFFAIGNPNMPPGTYGWLSIVDGALIWPAAACVFYQLTRAFKGAKADSTGVESPKKKKFLGLL